MVVCSLHQHKQDIWYAKALLPVFLHKDCKTIERRHKKKHCYLINSDRLLTVKKSKTWKTKTGRSWYFTFNSKIECLPVGSGKSYVFLVCGDKLCVIEWNEVMNPIGGLHIKEEGTSYSATGSKKSGKLSRTQIQLRRDVLTYFYS